MHPDIIVVCPYDPLWANDFLTEQARLVAAAPTRGNTIVHIGSTAVPGLAAKPVIDVMIGLDSLSEATLWIPVLQGLDYEYVPAFEAMMPERRYFRRWLDHRRSHQIHMVETNSVFWIRHLAFRDFLRAHPARASAYGRLKTDLAARFTNDRQGYMDGKEDFIKALEIEALSWWQDRAAQTVSQPSEQPRGVRGTTGE